jgi:uncharacterized membrane protein AbrB (regulator of aidB expression)
MGKFIAVVIQLMFALWFLGMLLALLGPAAPWVLGALIAYGIYRGLRWVNAHGIGTE